MLLTFQLLQAHDVGRCLFEPRCEDTESLVDVERCDLHRPDLMCASNAPALNSAGEEMGGKGLIRIGGCHKEAPTCVQIVWLGGTHQLEAYIA